MKIFYLQGATREDRHAVIAVAITPDSITTDKAIAAWSHAVRYTAKGLDLPDYDAAILRLLERHPSWKAERTQPLQAPYNGLEADNDLPE